MGRERARVEQRQRPSSSSGIIERSDLDILTQVTVIHMEKHQQMQDSRCSTSENSSTAGEYEQFQGISPRMVTIS